MEYQTETTAINAEQQHKQPTNPGYKRVENATLRKSTIVLKTLLVSGVVSLASINVSQAATESYISHFFMENDFYSDTQYPSREHSLNAFDEIWLPQFDASKGTLTDVILNITDISQTRDGHAVFRDGDVFSTTAGFISYNATVLSSGLLFGLPGTSTIRAFASPSDSCSATSLAWAAVCTAEIDETIQVPSYQRSSSDQAVLDSLTGTGDNYAKLWQSGYFYAEETDNDNGTIFERSSNVTTQGKLQLTYLYTPSPVPIPAAAWLFGSALFGLATVARKKSTGYDAQ